MLLTSSLVREAKADPKEKLVGLGVGMCSPGFDSQSRTAPALFSWGLQLFGRYGPDWGRWSWNLTVGASLSWATYSAVSRDYVHTRDSESTLGDLFFSGALYHPELLVAYKLLSGWDIAPYAELGLGYLWATYSDASLHDTDTGNELDASVDDFGDGGLTASLAFRIDWRVTRSLRIGAGLKYTRTAAALLKRTISVPITVTFFWW